MTDYNEILEAETDPEAPSTSSLWKRWSKNWIAAFEGNAPQKVQTNAIDDGAVIAQKLGVGAAGLSLAAAAFNAVGQYAFLAQPAITATNITAGANYAGSSLRYAGDVNGSTLSSSGAAPVGTWRAHGSVSSGSNVQRSTLFQRVL